MTENLTVNYKNEDEVGTKYKKVGALVAYKYMGTNSSILQLQTVLNYLEERRFRKAKREFDVKKAEKLKALAEKYSKATDIYEIAEVEKEIEKVKKGRISRQKIILGELQHLTSQDIWRFTAVNGEKYRIPEPTNGIDVVFECDFRRNE
jgi:hypothetical protein